MNEDLILKRIKQVFSEVFADANLEINSSTSAEDIEEWDSLTHVRLIISHELEFGLRFSTSEVGDLKTVQDLISLIASKLEA